MDTIRKSLFLSGAAALGVFGIVLLFKYILHHNTIKFEATGKGIDQKLHDSMEALDKATANVQQIFENIKHLKS